MRFLEKPIEKSFDFAPVNKGDQLTSFTKIDWNQQELESEPERKKIQQTKNQTGIAIPVGGDDHLAKVDKLQVEIWIIWFHFFFAY